ncbi:hypothetical protein V1460_21090 [Streptomyces sp. SCSIO 30461]|uniref:hypothetical protein n=1 Tax=Streptomyces sp. SCSIO 30461 TaxID=3118085 RepID=UPI0030D2C1AF
MARGRRTTADRGFATAVRGVPGSSIAEALREGATPTARWLFLGKDGRLSAYCPVPEGIVRWTESAPGSTEWTGPELFRVDGWTGRAFLSQGSDGLVYFAGMRHRDGAPGGREIVLATQFQTGRPLSSWRSVGNPFPDDAYTAERLGEPSVAADASGALHVFVHCFGHGVRARRRDPGGMWGPWTDMGNRWVRTPLAPVATSLGSVQALATFKDGVVHWAREAPGEDFRLLGRPSGHVVELTHTGCETGRGSVTFFWRHPAGAVVAYRRQQGGQGAPGALTSLGGDGGEGPVGVVRHPINGYDCTVLVQRGAHGGPEVAAYPTEGEHYGAWWAPVGEPCVGLPSVQVDGMGRIVLAMIRPDGSLWLSRQSMLDRGLSFEAWRGVG